MTRRSDALHHTWRTVAAVASAPAGTVATATNCSQAPAGDAFYMPPDPLPPGQR